MSEKKPEPLIRPQPQKKCPVCGHASYSVDGIHPQCHTDRADKKRRELIAAEAQLKSAPMEPHKKKAGFNRVIRVSR